MGQLTKQILSRVLFIVSIVWEMVDFLADPSERPCGNKRGPERGGGEGVGGGGRAGGERGEQSLCLDPAPLLSPTVKTRLGCGVVAGCVEAGPSASFLGHKKEPVEENKKKKTGVFCFLDAAWSWDPFRRAENDEAQALMLRTVLFPFPQPARGPGEGSGVSHRTSLPAPQALKLGIGICLCPPGEGSTGTPVQMCWLLGAGSRPLRRSHSPNNGHGWHRTVPPPLTDSKAHPSGSCMAASWGK